MEPAPEQLEIQTVARKVLEGRAMTGLGFDAKAVHVLPPSKKALALIRDGGILMQVEQIWN